MDQDDVGRSGNLSADRRTVLKSTGVVASTAVLGSKTASAQRSLSSVSKEFHTIESWDGTELRTTFFKPKGTGPHPAVLMTHGWGSLRHSPLTKPKALNYAKNGYVVLTYDSRGFGASEGVVNLNGPEETKDAQHLITWLANRPEVATEAADNPWIGMDGISYAGGIQFNVAHEDDRLDAMVPRITWNDLEYAIAPNDGIKIGWLSALLALGEFNTLLDSSAELTDDLGDWYWEALSENEVPDEAREAFQNRSVTNYDTVDTPAFLVQGWHDSLFNPTEALDTYRQLQDAGVESRIAIYEGGHDLSEVTVDFDDRGKMNSDALAWMDRHVKGESRNIPQIQNYLPQREEWRADETWPPQGVGYERYDLADASREGSNDLAKSGWWFGGDREVTYIWGISEDIEVIGEPEIDLTVNVKGPEAILFFELYRNGDNINGMDHAYRIRNSGTHEISLQYPAIQQYLANGDTIELNVSITNFWYLDSRESEGVSIKPGNSRLYLPQRPDDSNSAEQGGGGGGPGFTLPAAGGALGGAALYKRLRGAE